MRRLIDRIFVAIWFVMEWPVLIFGGCIIALYVAFCWLFFPDRL